jgi:hypothetical protein
VPLLRHFFDPNQVVKRQTFFRTEKPDFRYRTVRPDPDPIRQRGLAAAHPGHEAQLVPLRQRKRPKVPKSSQQNSCQVGMPKKYSTKSPPPKKMPLGFEYIGTLKFP